MIEGQPGGFLESMTSRLGISRDALVEIGRTTIEQRKMGLEPFDLNLEAPSLYNGNYQDNTTHHLRLYSPPLVYRRPRAGAGRFSLNKWETGLVKPVDLAEQIADNTRLLLERGEEKVRIVDFGAGSATTMRQAAFHLRDEIEDGRAEVIATNLFSVPSRHEISRVKAEHRPEPEWQAIEHDLVTFRRADILELYQYIRDDLEPVHYLFMNNMFGHTRTYHDTLFKLSIDMLHPELGTAVVGFGHLQKLYPDLPSGEGTLAETIEAGTHTLEEHGFRERNTLDLPDVLSGESKKVREDPSLLHVFEAPQAPPFPLFQAA